MSDFQEEQFQVPQSSFPRPVTPPDVDPDSGGVIQVFYNPAWAPVLAGALFQLLNQATWDVDNADDLVLALDRARLLINLLQGTVASGQGGGIYPISLWRFDDSTQEVQSSSDGGTTWQTNAGGDPRSSPSNSLASVGNSQCDAAANIVAYIANLVGQIESVLGAASSATGLVGIIEGLVADLGPYGWLVDLFLGFASLLFGIGESALSSAFTPTAYDTLLCDIYCYIKPDGTVDAAALSNMQSAWDTDLAGVAADVLDGMVTLVGNNGFNNMAQLGKETGDCSACTSCQFDHVFDFASGAQGWSAITSGFAGGTLSGGQWVSSDASVGVTRYRDVTINRAFASRVVTDIWVTYTRTAGNYSTGAGVYSLNDGTSDLVGHQYPPNTVPASIWHWSGSATLTQLRVFISATRCGTSCALAGAVAIQQIEIAGLGSDPF